MFTIKCIKHNGIEHVYSTRRYSNYPAERNSNGILVQTVVDDAGVQHHVSEEPSHSADLYVENAAGKTIHALHSKV